MNETNLARSPKSSQSGLNCKAEIELIDVQINKAETELDLLRSSNKAYSAQDIERKKNLELSLEDLRPLKCEFQTASKFEVGMWVVKNDSPTPGQVKGLYLLDSYPRVAVLYDEKEQVKHERPAQLTTVDQTYLEYIWTGEDYPKLIRRGDKKECVDLKVLEDNYISSLNIRDTHKECDAAPEDIQPFDRQVIYCKKQYQKITRDLFPAGTKVKVDQLTGQVLPYSERNPAYLQKVEVKLDDDTVRKFYPTEISIYQEGRRQEAEGRRKQLLGDSDPPVIEDHQIKDCDRGLIPKCSEGNRATQPITQPSALCPLPSALLAQRDKAKIIEFCSKPTIENVAIADICRNGGTQQRTGLNHETVKEYAEAMRQDDKFPPVKLRFDGENYWLTDGFHTTEAAWSIGRTEIEAEVIKGTQRDAILDSVGVNSNHGLRRSNADKRRAVTTLLQDEEWGQWSDREIARRCKVSQPFVSKLRTELTVNVDSHNPENDNKIITDNVISDNQRNYKDRYGNTSQMNTGNIGSDPKQEVLTVEPEADNKSKDKQEALQIDSTDNQDSNCLDKSDTVQISCPDKNVNAGNQTLVEQFEVDQVVKITTNAFRSDKRLVGHDTSLALVTKVNTASVDIKTWSACFEAVSFNDLRIIDPNDVPILCFQPTYKELQYLIANFDSKEEIIKAAIAARSLKI